MEQDLVGMAVLYFGGGESLTLSKLLKPEFYSQLSAPDAVAEFVHKKLKKVATPLVEEASVGSGGGVREPERARTPPPQRQPAPPLKTEGAVPKWFKTGK